MSYESVIKKSKRIEAQLQAIGAEGRGLHQKATSVEAKLNKSTLKAIRYIATIRNKLLHEDGFELSKKELKNFEYTAEKIILELEKMIKEMEKPSSFIYKFFDLFKVILNKFLK